MSESKYIRKNFEYNFDRHLRDMSKRVLCAILLRTCSKQSIPSFWRLCHIKVLIGKLRQLIQKNFEQNLNLIDYYFLYQTNVLWIIKLTIVWQL